MIKPTPDEVKEVILATYAGLPPAEQDHLKSILKRNRRKGRYEYGMGDTVGLEILGKLGMLLVEQGLELSQSSPPVA